MKTLKLERVGSVSTVTLTRPESRNAINLAMCGEIIEAFTGFQSDETIGLIVIRGEGAVFCAGVDMHEVKAHADSAVWYIARRNLGLDAYLAIEACPQPVVAIVHGPAIGGGCEVAGAADFVLASDAASFRYPEALFGAVGATQRLPRLVGTAMAKELLFTGRTITAAEALRIGLVNRVVPANILEIVFDTLVREITCAEPAAVRLIKQAIDRGAAIDLRIAIEIERALIAQSVAGVAWRNGADNFSRDFGRST